MDVQTIQSLVSTLGFPIVMCGVMVWYIKYLTESFQTQLTNITQSFTQEITQNRTDIEANKTALEQILQIVSAKKESD